MRAMAIETAPSRALKLPITFWAGLIVLAAIWLGPLPARAQTAFSPSMIIHLGVVAAAAPLLAHGLSRISPPTELRHSISWIWIAAFLDTIIVLGWHVPILHEAAARSPEIFAVEQLTFLMAGLAMWYLAFGMYSRGNALVVAAAFFMTFMHMSVLGIILVLAPHLLYDADLCRGAFGFAPLDDQRLGGILMASWGSFTYLAGAMWLIWQALAREQTHPAR
jgi:putative membrane protein